MLVVIFDAIIQRNAELIVYKYGDEEEEYIKDLFIRASIRHSEATEQEIAYVKSRIYVIAFKENDTYFLGTEKR